MNGGMTKAAAHGAIAVLAGLLLSTASAQAADLGGNCCADLEERVAELEATTARKGNRRVSLTISGQVNRSILYWNGLEGPVNGDDSGVYAGLDNHTNSTRFIFSGTANIRPNLRAGFEFMTEWASGARTSQVDQDTPDGRIDPTTFRNTDGVLAVRTANWYLEDKHWGRMTVGRLNVGGPVGTIDLGGVGLVAHFSPGLVGGSFFVAGGSRLGAVIGPTYGGDRIEGIRYDSANLGGFVLQGTWGEDDLWSASVRYAGEFGGFRVAAGIGYFEQDGTLSQPIQLDTGPRPTDNEWSGSLAVMHVASGLFAQGHIAESEFFNGTEGNFWLIQAGISKNWFGMGKTSVYGEYGSAEDYIKSGSAANLVGFPLATSDVDFFGVGVVQNIDAAAMSLYLGWRRFEVEVGGVHPDTGLGSDLDLIHGGAIIRF